MCVIEKMIMRDRSTLKWFISEDIKRMSSRSRKLAHNFKTVDFVVSCPPFDKSFFVLMNSFKSDIINFYSNLRRSHFMKMSPWCSLRQLCISILVAGHHHKWNSLSNENSSSGWSALWFILRETAWTQTRKFVWVKTIFDIMLLANRKEIRFAKEMRYKPSFIYLCGSARTSMHFQKF